MWHRPWRWLIAAISAGVVLALANQVVLALGETEFLGLALSLRLVIFGALTGLLSAFVIPSAEAMDRGNPLPPLPRTYSNQNPGTS
jgi:hypothetical protein